MPRMMRLFCRLDMKWLRRKAGSRAKPSNKESRIQFCTCSAAKSGPQFPGLLLDCSAPLPASARPANVHGGTMGIANWPLQERPREKLLQLGPDKLSDAELLAIFLRTGTSGQSALDLARSLLTKFGGVRGVLEAGKDPFCAEPGMGESKYAQLQAALELARRHMLEALQRSDCLTSSALTRNYIRSRMRAYEREVFLCLFLDNQHRVIAQEELFHGTIDGSMVHPREVVR